MKSILLIFFITAFTNYANSQCRLIPDRDDAEMFVRETFRDKAFQIKKSGQTYLCGLSAIKILMKKTDQKLYAFGVTITSPATNRLVMKTLSMVDQNNNVITLTDIDGDPETFTKGETGTTYSTIKYTVYLTYKEYKQLQDSKLNNIAVYDPRRDDKGVVSTIPYAGFISDLIKCVDK